MITMTLPRNDALILAALLGTPLVASMAAKRFKNDTLAPSIRQRIWYQIEESMLAETIEGSEQPGPMILLTDLERHALHGVLEVILPKLGSNGRLAPSVATMIETLTQTD